MAYEKSKKVLIVEDYEDVRRMMKIYLTRGGYHVVEARDGYEAVEKAVEERPDMIIMDIAMPILDGIDAVKAIRQHAELAEIPIVALSAYGDFYREKAYRVGCDDVMQKPINLDLLPPLVKRYIH